MHVRTLVITAMFAALIAAGAYIAVPIGPVPITLQTLFIVTAGLLGGRAIGISAYTVYLIAGAAGLPVFSGGTGGFAHLAGPTGGFLIGGLLSVLLAGIFGDAARRGRERISVPLVTIGALLGGAAFYLVGIPWLKINLGLAWSSTFAAGMVPFIPGDLLKTVAAVALTKVFNPRIEELLAAESGDLSDGTY